MYFETILINSSYFFLYIVWDPYTTYRNFLQAILKSSLAGSFKDADHLKGKM